MIQQTNRGVFSVDIQGLDHNNWREFDRQQANAEVEEEEAEEEEQGEEEASKTSVYIYFFWTAHALPSNPEPFKVRTIAPREQHELILRRGEFLLDRE